MASRAALGSTTSSPQQELTSPLHEHAASATRAAFRYRIWGAILANEDKPLITFSWYRDKQWKNKPPVKI
eukprot:13570765-Heterocapsa_arctica.AAC.1